MTLLDNPLSTAPQIKTYIKVQLSLGQFHLSLYQRLELAFMQLRQTRILLCNCIRIIWTLAWPGLKRDTQKARVRYSFCLH